MDPEIIQGGLMQNLGMDEGTAYRYAAEISASPELYGDVLAKIGLSDGFQAKFRAANPRPARYDPKAERELRHRCFLAHPKLRYSLSEMPFSVTSSFFFLGFFSSSCFFGALFCVMVVSMLPSYRVDTFSCVHI